jgi:hypothetical protein
VRKEWPFYIAVACAGVVAGVAIAGLPDDDESLSITAPSTTIEVIATFDSIAEGGTGSLATTTVVASSPVVPDSTAPVATDAPPATTADTTTTSAAAPTSTVATPTTVAPTGPLDRAAVRLVLANGDGRFNLVGRNADRLLALGYVTIDQTDVGDRPAATTIYFRPGFDDEAAILAGDLQTPNAIVTALPATPITANDDAGDLIVVLGPDAQR